MATLLYRIVKNGRTFGMVRADSPEEAIGRFTNQNPNLLTAFPIREGDELLACTLWAVEMNNFNRNPEKGKS